MAYCTLNQVREYGKFRTSETDANALLTNIIDRVTAAFERETNRVFEAGSDTSRSIYPWQMDVDGKTLFISDDLCAITSISNDGSAVDSGDYVLLTYGDSSVWRTGERIHAIRLLHDSRLAWVKSESKPIEITGRWAYSTTPPADVVQACIEWSFAVYKRAEHLTTNGMPNVTVDGKLVMSSQMPQYVRETIEAYRRIGVV